MFKEQQLQQEQQQQPQQIKQHAHDQKQQHNNQPNTERHNERQQQASNGMTPWSTTATAHGQRPMVNDGNGPWSPFSKKLILGITQAFQSTEVDFMSDLNEQLDGWMDRRGAGSNRTGLSMGKIQSQLNCR